MTTLTLSPTMIAAEPARQRRLQRSALWVGLVNGSGPWWWRLLRWSQRNQV
ncbi:MAG: hypothetical protein AABZ45_00645 [Pseudomonadota bacterium]